MWDVLASAALAEARAMAAASATLDFAEDGLELALDGALNEAGWSDAASETAFSSS